MFNCFTTCSIKKCYMRMFLLLVAASYSWIAFFRKPCTQSEYIRNPDRYYIQKYNQNINFVPMNSLFTQCGYNGSSIICPDVRHHGETMHRQNLLVLMRMLLIFHLICERYNIEYWIDGGTLLGAKRNSEIFAWEHDADVCMLPKDYTKLLKYIRLDLPDDLYFQDGSIEREFGLDRNSPAKIRDNNSCYTKCIRKGCKMHDGLQLDVFIARIRKGNRFVCDQSKHTYQEVSDVLPTGEIILEGFKLKSPANPHKYLTSDYGQDYMTPISNQYPPDWIPVPWYSCEQIMKITEKQRIELLENIKSC